MTSASQFEKVQVHDFGKLFASLAKKEKENKKKSPTKDLGIHMVCKSAHRSLSASFPVDLLKLRYREKVDRKVEWIIIYIHWGRYFSSALVF